MAGDELKKDRNYAAREAIASNPKKAEARLGNISDEYDLGGYSDKDVIMAYKGGTFDDRDYARLTGGDRPVNEPSGGIEPEVDGDPVDPSSPVAEPIETGSGDVNMPSIPMPASPFGGGQYVVQDNDLVSNVSGDNNTVNQEQDNSVKNFGGEYEVSDWKNSWMNSKFSA